MPSQRITFPGGRGGGAQLQRRPTGLMQLNLGCSQIESSCHVFLSTVKIWVDEGW